MTRALTVAVVALTLASSAGAQPLQPSAVLTVSSHKPAAKPVALTYTLRYEMQCGSPGKGPLTLSFPAQITVPRVSATDVLLDGRAAPAVKRDGSTLVVSLPPQPAIICDSITMGTLTITITKGVGLANPKSPGIYAFPVTSDKVSAMPKLRIA